MRCPNPECPHRRRTGEAAEYRDGFEVCADCGAALEEGAVGSPVRSRRAPWPSPVRRRLALAVGLLVLVWLAGFMPHPMLGWEGSEWLTGRGARTGPFSLGVRPLLLAFVLVELVALVAPSLRGRRRTDPALRRTLWRVSLGLGLALATVQALAVSFGLETMVANASWYDAPPLPEPGWLFRIETTAALVIGTGLLALVALLLDQNRLGRGFALLLLLEAGVQLGWSGGELVHALRVGALTPLAAGLVLAGVAACCWAFSWLFAQRGPVPLPACGLWPLDVGLVVALGPPTLAALGLLIFPAELIADLVPGQRLYLEVVIAGVLLWVIPAATLFHWRRRRALWGPSRRVWMRTLGGSAAFLVALVLIDHVAWNQGAGLAWPGVLVVLSAYALAADWWTEIDAWRRSPGGRPLQILEQHQDPVDALAALAALRAADPDGHYAVTGLRFRALTWFFAPYVPLLVLGAPPDPSR